MVWDLVAQLLNYMLPGCLGVQTIGDGPTPVAESQCLMELGWKMGTKRPYGGGAGWVLLMVLWETWDCTAALDPEQASLWEALETARAEGEAAEDKAVCCLVCLPTS